MWTRQSLLRESKEARGCVGSAQKAPSDVRRHRFLAEHSSSPNGNFQSSHNVSHGVSLLNRAVMQEASSIKSDSYYSAVMRGRKLQENESSPNVKMTQ
jgi:hypothetical protein